MLECHLLGEGQTSNLSRRHSLKPGVDPGVDPALDPGLWTGLNKYQNIAKNIKPKQGWQRFLLFITQGIRHMSRDSHFLECHKPHVHFCQSKKVKMNK